MKQETVVATQKTKEIISITYECRKDELMNLPLGDYKVVIDLKNDSVLVTNGRMRGSWMKIADIEVIKDTKKAREDAAREVRRAVDKLEKMCKSTVIKTYGKEIAEKAPVWQYVDNPYYKCSPQMQLYIKESMNYLYRMDRIRKIGTGKLQIQPIVGERLSSTVAKVRKEKERQLSKEENSRQFIWKSGRYKRY